MRGYTRVSKLMNHLSLHIYHQIQKIDKNWIKVWGLVDKAKGWLSKDEAYLLYCLAKKVAPNKNIVEIGSYEGRSTIALAGGVSPGVFVYAIDPHTGDRSEIEAGLTIDTWSNFQANTQAYDCIHAIRKFSVDATQEIGTTQLELIFIDGWHSEDAVDEDIHSYLPFAAEEFTIVFDDWSHPEVKAGIKKNLKYLPPLIGIIGKDLVFSNKKEIRKSFFAKIVKHSTNGVELRYFSLENRNSQK
jgi:predicted O-methyltransferase YrrM